MQDTLLIIHFFGLALGVGTGFALARLGSALRDAPVADRGLVMKYALSISKNGGLGLGLLILSGLAMLFTRGVSTVFASGGMAFHIKLLLVVIMAGLVGFSQVQVKRLREKKDPAALATLQKIGPVITFTGVAIVICAVLAFH